VIAGVMVSAIVIYSVTGAASRARNEFYEKQELARVISDANDELRRLRGQNAMTVQGSDQNWKTILSGLAGSRGIPPENLEILKEQAGKAQSTIQETLLEVRLKAVPLPSLVQFLTQIERGTPPMKLKGLVVEPTAEGPLTARLNLSGYLSKSEKGEKSK
jgi:hypothetical protein